VNVCEREGGKRGFSKQIGNIRNGEWREGEHEILF